MQITPEPEPGRCIFCMKPLPDAEVCDCPGYRAWIDDEMQRLKSLSDEDEKCSPDAD